MKIDMMWAVTTPTPDSELCDIMFRTHAAELELQFKGGLSAHGDGLTLYTEHDEALEDAMARMKVAAEMSAPAALPSVHLFSSRLQDPPAKSPLEVAQSGGSGSQILAALPLQVEEPVTLTGKQIAVMIRFDLKKAFPDHKFSVITRNYAGGSSVDVDWTAGPDDDAVWNEIKYLNRHGFDGSTDSTTNAGPYTGKDGKLYRMRSYIFTRRHKGDPS